MMALGLKDRVIILTGAGNGLGRTYALLLASLGSAVVVNDIERATDETGSPGWAADDVVAEIVSAGGNAVASYSTVTTPEGAREIVRTAVDAFGKLDGVVNNAGVLRDRSLAKLSPEEIDVVLDVHLKGTLYVSQAAFPTMKAAGFGRFVHTTSGAGLFGNFGQANYAAAKMGIVGLSRTIAEEGARFGITSNVVAPLARTRLTEGMLGPLSEALDPSHVSPLVAYLLSPSCTLNREIISAGGGRFARVFTGLTPGWCADRGVTATAEQIAEHIDEILDVDGFIIPQSATDELKVFADALGDGSGAGMQIGAR
jgi:NAD(P)-dependent dehydrogenase (short-subunit alcohol dehydrogenase family)